MMKKRLAILLAAAFAMSTTFTAMAADDVSGEWYGNMFGMAITLVVEEDGTFTIDGFDETATGTWTMEGDELILDEQEESEDSEEYENMYLKYDGESLTADMGGAEFVLTRNPDDLIGFVPPEIKEDAVIEDFEGKWSASQAFLMDMTFPADLFVDQIGIESFTLTVEEGGIIDFAIAVPEDEFAVLDSLEIEKTQTEFKDGTLNFVIPAEDEGHEDKTWVIKCHEDGTLSMITEGDFFGEMIFYMTEATEAE